MSIKAARPAGSHQSVSWDGAWPSLVARVTSGEWQFSVFLGSQGLFSQLAGMEPDHLNLCLNGAQSGLEQYSSVAGFSEWSDCCGLLLYSHGCPSVAGGLSWWLFPLTYARKFSLYRSLYTVLTSFCIFLKFNCVLLAIRSNPGELCSKIRMELGRTQ